MKIVFVTDVYYPSIGGVEVETRRLAAKLSRGGHKVWIITPSNKPLDCKWREKSVVVLGVKSYPNPFYESMRFVPPYLAERKISKILNEVKPDIIHIQTGFSLAKAASLYSKRFGVASVATGHYAGGEVENSFKKLGPISKFIGFTIKKSNKSVWKNVDLLTFPSSSSKEYFQSAIKDQNRALVLSNGIDTKKFSGRTRNGSNKNVLVYVGRLEPHKNVETIIKSMTKTLAKIDAKLILVGGGTQERNLRKLVSELGIEKNVVFTGFISEEKVKMIYKKANLFVTASLAENQPLSVLEAIASGLPVVATRVGGIPDLVKEGRNGFLFNPGDSNAIARNVVYILSNKSLLERMRRESVDIAKEYDINEVVYKMESLYQKAIALNSQKEEMHVSAPSHNWLFVRLAFAVVMLALLFRWTFLAPSTAKAKSVSMGARIKNLKLIKNIEKIDSKLETDFSNKFLKKLEK